MDLHNRIIKKTDKRILKFKSNINALANEFSNQLILDAGGIDNLKTLTPSELDNLISRVKTNIDMNGQFNTWAAEDVNEYKGFYGDVYSDDSFDTARAVVQSVGMYYVIGKAFELASFRVISGMSEISNTAADKILTGAFSDFSTDRIATDTQGAVFESVTADFGKANNITQYIYVGPNDDRTRPFCREHIGQIKTEAEWNALDNGQINPVFLYCGGYNCRHAIVPNVEGIT
jgi:hypothetical protein